LLLPHASLPAQHLLHLLLHHVLLLLLLPRQLLRLQVLPLLLPVSPPAWGKLAPRCQHHQLQPHFRLQLLHRHSAGLLQDSSLCLLLLLLLLVVGMPQLLLEMLLLQLLPLGVVMLHWETLVAAGRMLVQAALHERLYGCRCRPSRRHSAPPAVSAGHPKASRRTSAHNISTLECCWCHWC
jgi:hypothetical protein